MESENLLLQNVLQDAGFQVEMSTLQNPTEEFMTHLITEYFKKLQIDGNEISKSTKEQLICLFCPDSAADAIRTINLFSALSSVCNEIFLQDFCLTDISSPGPKRARRQMKILFNFLAYVKNKLTDNEPAFIELDDQLKAIERMFEKKESTIAKIGATINDRENKLDLIKKFQDEINLICEEMEKNNIKSKELEEKVKNIMIQHQETNKKCTDLKAKVVKLHKETSELQTRIVKSPEEYASRCKELEKLLKIKKEERQILTDSITRKKLQIKSNENAQDLVKNLNDIFSSNSSETLKQLKETSEKLEYVQKELELLKKDIAKWQNTEINNSPNTSNVEGSGHECLLSELENQYENKKREFHSLKRYQEELKTDLHKKKSILEEELKAISIIQEKNLDNSMQYKEYFENQISEELVLRKEVKNVVKF